jgi:glycosyltransferase involved in cell wall biosynthesis
VSRGATNPKVSIGIPTYNGEQGLTNVLNSILSQTFTDFELIISDNASSDKTQLICTEYMSKDKRVRYIRQDSNIGPCENFKFVLNESCGEYFMWAADDDIRSDNFLEEVVNLLDKNPNCIAAMTPDCMEGELNVRDFSITGSQYNRFKLFIENCWASHGIFYSLARANLIKDFNFDEFKTLGGDWLYNTYLLSKGDICRTKKGMTTFGKDGISNSNQRFSNFRKNIFNWIFPFYDFSIYMWKLSYSFSIKQKFLLFYSLLRLNIFTAVLQVKFEFSLKIEKL